MKGLFQCPPWARSFCPFRACGAYLIGFSCLFNRLLPAFFNTLLPALSLLRDALAVDGAPGKDDVGEHERDEEGDYRHGAERELAAATVGESERTLKVDVRRIVGGIVPAGYQQQNQHGKHGSCLLYTSPSPRDAHESRMPSSA